MKKLPIIVLMLFLLAFAGYGQRQKNVTVKFKPGTSTATVTGSGEDEILYDLGTIKKGQTLKITTACECFISTFSDGVENVGKWRNLTLKLRGTMPVQFSIFVRRKWVKYTADIQIRDGVSKRPANRKTAAIKNAPVFSPIMGGTLNRALNQKIAEAQRRADKMLREEAARYPKILGTYEFPDNKKPMVVTLAGGNEGILNVKLINDVKSMNNETCVLTPSYSSPSEAIEYDVSNCLQFLSRKPTQAYFLENQNGKMEFIIGFQFEAPQAYRRCKKIK